MGKHRNSGWPGEKQRHSMSARGVSTKTYKHKYSSHGRFIDSMTIKISEQDFAKLVGEAESMTKAKQGVEKAFSKYGKVNVTFDGVVIEIDEDGLRQFYTDMLIEYDEWSIQDKTDITQFIWGLLSEHIRAPHHRGRGMSIWEFGHDEIGFEPEIIEKLEGGVI